MNNDAKRSVFWSGIQNVASHGINFLITIVIARLLTPEDYGLIAMLSVFYAVAQAFVDSGLGSALIQKKECTERDYNSVFFFSVIIAFILYIVLYLCAPLIARLYNNELLINISRVYLLSLVINAVGIIPMNKMQKNLLFKQFALISFGSSITGGVIAIVMAYRGMAYWALVFQTLSSTLLSTILYYVFSKWRPTLSFDFSSMKEMISFGFPVMLTSLLQAVYNNIYSLVIGARYTSRDLGLYNRAYSYGSTIPINFSNFSMRAMFPVLSKAQKNHEGLRDSIYNMLHMSMFVIIPINVYFVFNSLDIVRITLGEKWMELAPYLSILSIGSVSYVITNMHICAFKVVGKTKNLFVSELIRKIVGIIVLLLTVPYGVRIMIYGSLIFSFIDTIISTLYLKKCVCVTMWGQIKAIYSPVLFSIVAGIGSIVTGQFMTELYLRFITCLVLFFSIYFIMALLFKDKGLSFVRNYFKG
jgi:O-antigen/teichoic acid export membrane protein